MVRKLFSTSSLSIICILLFAAVLRLSILSSLPASMNQDEVALGYNTYSILKTGADEHGKFLPLVLESFGDWKLPGYVYASIPSIAIFGLSEFAVRLPSALSGIVGVFLIYKISLLLFQKKLIGLFAAFFFAVSPWSIHFSRAAYEVNLATSLFLAGVYFFLLYVYQKEKKTKFLFLSSVFFSATVFVYHSYIFFTPLFLFALGFIFRQQLKRDARTMVFILFFLFSSVTAVWITASTGVDKVSTLSIFNDENVLYERVEKFRTDGSPENQLLMRVIHNRYVGGIYHLSQNYLATFSPSFLFDRGGEKLQHNVEGIGNLYLFDAVFVIIGCAALIRWRKKSLPFLAAWLFLAPIPSAITKDTPNSTRLFMLMPLFVLLSSYGAYILYEFLRTKGLKFFLIPLIGFVVLFNVVYFFDLYFTHFNAQRIRFWRYGYPEVIEVAKQYPEYRIVIIGPENFPYIYALFYEQYDPKLFQKTVSYMPRTHEGFLHVRSFGRYQFPQNIDYATLEPKTIYFDDRSVERLPHALSLPSGEPIFGYTVSD